MMAAAAMKNAGADMKQMGDMAGPAALGMIYAEFLPLKVEKHNKFFSDCKALLDEAEVMRADILDGYLTMMDISGMDSVKVPTVPIAVRAWYCSASLQSGNPSGFQPKITKDGISLPQADIDKLSEENREFFYAFDGWLKAVAVLPQKTAEFTKRFMTNAAEGTKLVATAAVDCKAAGLSMMDIAAGGKDLAKNNAALTAANTAWGVAITPDKQATLAADVTGLLGGLPGAEAFRTADMSKCKELGLSSPTAADVNLKVITGKEFQKTPGPIEEGIRTALKKRQEVAKEKGIPTALLKKGSGSSGSSSNSPVSGQPTEGVRSELRRLSQEVDGLKKAMQAGGAAAQEKQGWFSWMFCGACGPVKAKPAEVIKTDDRWCKCCRSGNSSAACCFPSCCGAPSCCCSCNGSGTVKKGGRHVISVGGFDMKAKYGDVDVTGVMPAMIGMIHADFKDLQVPKHTKFFKDCGILLNEAEVMRSDIIDGYLTMCDITGMDHVAVPSVPIAVRAWVASVALEIGDDNFMPTITKEGCDAGSAVSSMSDDNKEFLAAFDGWLKAVGVLPQKTAEFTKRFMELAAEGTKQVATAQFDCKAAGLSMVQIATGAKDLAHNNAQLAAANTAWGAAITPDKQATLAADVTGLMTGLPMADGFRKTDLAKCRSVGLSKPSAKEVNLQAITEKNFQKVPGPIEAGLRKHLHQRKALRVKYGL